MQMTVFARSLICLSLSVTLGSIVAQEKEPQLDGWLARATNITEDLVQDGIALTPYERALLWARMARVWDKNDQIRASAWMQKSVEIVELAPEKESESERRRRLDTVQMLLHIYPSMDRNLKLRLEAILTASENGTTDSGPSETPESLIDSAVAVVDTEPTKAFELGVASLRLGRTYKLASLLWRLRKRDSRLADGLFDQALAGVSTTFDPESLSWLGQYAFNGPAISDERRKALLGVIAESFLRSSASIGGQTEACKLAPIAATHLGHFGRLLPQQAVMVRQALTQCQSTIPNSARITVAEALRDRPPRTAHELEAEAEKATNRNIRDEYLTRAATLAAQQKEFELAVNLLDRISSDGRKELSGGWESWRWSYAASAAVAQLQCGDRAAMYQIIAATPASLRALVQIKVAQELGRLKDLSTAVELLNKARHTLGQSSARETVDGYFSLLRQYENLMPIDALNVLNEAVKAINRADTADPPSTQRLHGEQNPLLNDLVLRTYTVPVTLLLKEEAGVRVAISSIKSPDRRAAIRLNMLSAVLTRHQSAGPAIKPATSKMGRPVAQ